VRCCHAARVRFGAALHPSSSEAAPRDLGTIPEPAFAHGFRIRDPCSLTLVLRSAHQRVAPIGRAPDEVPRIWHGRSPLIQMLQKSVNQSLTPQRAPFQSNSSSSLLTSQVLAIPELAR